MFAVVRTGGKQYRVAAGDKIVVDRMDGEAGARIAFGEGSILFAGADGEAASLAGLTVAAEIIAQAKADKVIVFKKKRRHNYRRKNGHRQQHTILRILSVGKEEKKAAPKKEAAPVAAAPEAAPAEAPKKAAPKAAAPKAAATEAKPVAKKAAKPAAPKAETKTKPAAKKAAKPASPKASKE